jgi:hypothetical protein
VKSKLAEPFFSIYRRSSRGIGLLPSLSLSFQAIHLDNVRIIANDFPFEWSFKGVQVESAPRGDPPAHSALLRILVGILFVGILSESRISARLASRLGGSSSRCPRACQARVHAPTSRSRIPFKIVRPSTFVPRALMPARGRRQTANQRERERERERREEKEEAAAPCAIVVF